VGLLAEQVSSSVGQGSEFRERQIMEAAGLGAVDAPAVPDLLDQRIEGGIMDHG
jgi:hypothetical protein